MIFALSSPDALLGEVCGKVRESEYIAAVDRIRVAQARECAHIAVMREPYLSYVLSGKKTVESRFLQHRRPPYQRVNRGDVLLFKAQSGPIVGTALVGSASHYAIDPDVWRFIQGRFSSALCADEQFWEERQNAKYCSLIRVRCTTRIDPILIDKRDRRGWVVLQRGPYDLQMSMGLGGPNCGTAIAQ